MRNWPNKWLEVEDTNEIARLNSELFREAPQGHVLFGRRVELIGRHSRHDDFLFQLDDWHTARVHLTWRVETDPFYPFTIVYPSFEAWASAEELGEID